MMTDTWGSRGIDSIYKVKKFIVTGYVSEIKNIGYTMKI